jgi:hypothetical protein
MVIIEAYKFWFYAMVLSLAGTVWDVWRGQRRGNSSLGRWLKKEKRNGAGGPPDKGKGKGVKFYLPALVRRVLINKCDLLIPGTFLGRVRVVELTVEVKMVLRTMIGLGDSDNHHRCWH